MVSNEIRYLAEICIKPNRFVEYLQEKKLLFRYHMSFQISCNKLQQILTLQEVPIAKHRTSGRLPTLAAHGLEEPTTLQASSGAFLAGEKIKLSNIFYVKETVQVVPENTQNTHRVNPSSVTSVSSVGTIVMFLSLD